MTTEVVWYIKDRVVYLLPDATPSLDDYRKTIQRIVDYFDQSSASSVHLLSDQRRRKMPLNLNFSLLRANQYMQPIITHPRRGLLVSFHEQHFLFYQMGRLFTAMYHANYHHFRSSTQALAFLAEHDPTLPPLPDIETFFAAQFGSPGKQ
ncbi:MAG: hypothetical protein CUN54_02830 [Phototrophicales bacterium]|nr:MAG: hypothetical protein CUN54_02830 [Phototrophicales bacterium]